MDLPGIPLVNDKQVAFAARFGLNVEGESVGVAAARISDRVAVEFFGEVVRQPTEKQVALLRQFGIEGSRESFGVVSATISDLMMQLNLDAVRVHGLTPGLDVVNVHDPLERVETISSIRPDGTVYLKGGNGKRAWARNLRPADVGVNRQ